MKKIFFFKKFSLNQQWKILGISLSILLSIFLVYIFSRAGSLTPSNTPGDTMKTLEDIYYRLDKDASSPPTYGLNPPGSPGSTMHTLQQIYDKTPDFHDNPGDADTADVYKGKTFYKDSATRLTGTLERAGYSVGTISSTYANGETDRYVVDQSGANDKGIDDSKQIIPGKYAWSNGTWYGPGTFHFWSGQTTSYRTGDEASVAAKGKSYTDNGDGTVTDDCNGLMWAADDHSSDTWNNAIDYCYNIILCNDGSWLNDCTGHGGNKYDDWHLPSIREGLIMLNYECGSAGGSCYDDFQDSALQWTNGGTTGSYWLSTTCRDSTGNAYILDLGTGELNTAAKTSTYPFRCVRWEN